MRVFKKGKYYHYEFEFERKRYQGSTHRKNEREAIQMAGAIQFNIMKENGRPWIERSGADHSRFSKEV